MRATAVQPREQELMFAAAEARLREDLGEVSIAKFLQARTREEAQQKWFAAISAFVAAMPQGSFLRAGVESGWPVLECAGGVTMRMRISELWGGESSDDAWHMPMTQDVVVVLVDAIGWRRWGSAWADEVGARVGGSPERTPIAVSEPGAEGWMLDGSPDFASLLWFRDRERAARAARALALGRSAVDRLFLELSGGPHA